MKQSKFYKQIKLLIDVLPYIAKENCFALKGGTAINLFVRNCPRLSVDIDLTYLGNEDRDQALELTEKALYRIKADIVSRLSGVKIIPSSKAELPNDVKLFISSDGAQIKIEANPVIRGTLFPAVIKSLAPKIFEEFETEIDIQIVDIPDLYGGKIAAALDRQHPRDLFDIKLLFEAEGVTLDIKDGFIAYLLSHKRPPYEVLKPTKKDMSSIFTSEFEGMAELKFSYQDFEDTRDRLMSQILDILTDDDKKFLLSFYGGSPDWSLFSHEHAKDLPAIKWKLKNIEKLDAKKKKMQIQFLEKIF